MDESILFNLNFLMPDPDLNYPGQIREAVKRAVGAVMNPKSDAKTSEVIESVINRRLSNDSVNKIRIRAIENMSFSDQLDIRYGQGHFEEKEVLYGVVKDILKELQFKKDIPPVDEKKISMKPIFFFLFLIIVITVLWPSNVPIIRGGGQKKLIDDDFAFMI